MEKRSILLKYGELILKGANRSYFDAVLLRQVRRKLKPLGEFRVFTSQSTVFVESEDDALLDLALPELQKVFGRILHICGVDVMQFGTIFLCPFR